MRKEAEKPAGGAGGGQLAESGFSSLILSIASAALLNLEPEAAMGAAGGESQGGESSARIAAAAGLKADLKMARHNIDLLGLLREKTKGNLTEKEARLLDACEKDLQLKYVMMQSKKEGPEPSKAEPELSKAEPAGKAPS